MNELKSGAKRIGYWDDLKGTPDEGPFIVCGGPVGANVPRIEHARGPEGIGCPVVLEPEMYAYIERNGIPRGHEGACRLNELYRAGAFVWSDLCLRPAR